MKYANDEEAREGDLIVFTDSSSSQDYDAVGILFLLDPTARFNVRPVARALGKIWQPTSDHMTHVAIETALPVPNLAGLLAKAVPREEITSCAKDQCRPGRALAHGVCERCGRMAHDHPWKAPAPKVEDPPKDEEKTEG